MYSWMMMFWSNRETDGITVTVPDQAALLSDLGARFERGAGFTIATLNLDHVVKLARDPAFHAAYQAHSHVTADGNPIVWLSRLARQPVSLVPGSELVVPLAQLAAQKGVPVALFGASEETLTQAKSGLMDRCPGLEVVYCHAPAMGFDPMGEVAQTAIEALNASGARLCFIALGAPKQELFAARAQTALPQVGFVSVGAGLDFIAGTQARAPVWVQGMAGEWLWRLLGNPRRLAARYGACFAVLPELVVRALRARRNGGAPS